MKQLAWILPFALVVGIGCDPRVEPIETVRNNVLASVSTGADTSTTVGVTLAAIQLRIRAEGDEEEDIEIFPSGGFESSVVGGVPPARTTIRECVEDAQCPGSNDAQALRCVGGFCVVYPQVDSEEIDCNIYDIRFVATVDGSDEVCEQTINFNLIDDPDVAGQASGRADDDPCTGPYKCVGFDEMAPDTPGSCTALDGLECASTDDCNQYSCVFASPDDDMGVCRFSQGVPCTNTTQCGGPFLCRGGACDYEYSAANDGAWLCYVAERWDLSNHISKSACPDFFPDQ